MPTLPNPFAPAEPVPAEPSRFVFDERAFVEALEPPPLFLQQAPLHADDLAPVLKLLAGY